MVMDTFGSSLKLTNSVLHGRLVFNLGQDGVHLRTNIPGRSSRLQKATSQPAILPSQFAQLLGALCVYPTVANHHHHLAGCWQKTKAPLQSLAFYSCWSRAIVDAGKFHIKYRIETCIPKGLGKNIPDSSHLQSGSHRSFGQWNHPIFFLPEEQTAAGGSLKMYAGLGGLCVFH